MIEVFKPFDKEIQLKTDHAGEYPIYIYQSDDKDIVIYSKSLTELLDDSRVIKPLEINIDGISHLLQNGVVPVPNTAYKNIYILIFGDLVKLRTIGQKTNIEFSNEFPFKNEKRDGFEEINFEKNFLDKLAKATIERIDKTKKTYLFHSAGKDSNSIALALAEHGMQNDVTLVTHKSKGASDESEISKSIAEKLGFKHLILQEIDKLNDQHKEEINKFFENAPLPCTDNVYLAYPLYIYQYPDFISSNIIDGGGNDSYMGIPPSLREELIFKLTKRTQKLGFLRKYIKTESKIQPFIRTPAEWCSLAGLSYYDTKKILNNSKDVYPYWYDQTNKKYKFDLYDFKTNIYTYFTIPEMHIRKARNFCEAIGSNLILPFANESVSHYVYNLPERRLFNRKNRDNKIFIRDLLLEKLNINSNVIGKMGYEYDFNSVVIENIDYMISEIKKCSLFDAKEIDLLLKRFQLKTNNKRKNYIKERMIYRLYVICMWINYNKWINK